MKPHVLLAGGTGYIGKSLIKELRDTTTLRHYILFHNILKVSHTLILQ